MKSVIISLSIACTIITGSIIYTRFLKDFSSEMTSYVNSIKDSINNDDYKNASKTAKKLHDIFHDKHFFLAGTVDHSIISKIEEGFAEMYVYTREQQRYDAIAKCDNLLYYFDYLLSNYSLRLENIL